MSTAVNVGSLILDDQTAVVVSQRYIWQVHNCPANKISSYFGEKCCTLNVSMFHLSLGWQLLGLVYPIICMKTEFLANWLVQPCVIALLLSPVVDKSVALTRFKGSRLPAFILVLAISLQSSYTYNWYTGDILNTSKYLCTLSCLRLLQIIRKALFCRRCIFFRHPYVVPP